MKKLFIFLTILAAGCANKNQNSADTSGTWQAPVLKVKRAKSNPLDVFDSSKGEVLSLQDQLRFDPSSDVVTVAVTSSCRLGDQTLESTYTIANEPDITVKHLVPATILQSDKFDKTVCDFKITIRNLEGSQKLYEMKNSVVVAHDYDLAFTVRNELTAAATQQLGVFDIKLTNNLQISQTFSMISRPNTMRVHIMQLYGAALFHSPEQGIPTRFNFNGLQIRESQGKIIFNIPPISESVVTMYVDYTQQSCDLSHGKIAGLDFSFDYDFNSLPLIEKGARNLDISEFDLFESQKSYTPTINFLENTGTNRSRYFLPVVNIEQFTSAEAMREMATGHDLKCN